MQSYLILLAGIACAAVGGEFFVKGAVGLAHWARVSPATVAVTVAAFATSSPELSVSVSSALAGTPQIAMGDALGSNVVNVALILGSTLAIAAIRSPRESLRRDFPAALAVPVVTAVLVSDGVLSRQDGVLLLALFGLWLALALREAHRQRKTAANPGAQARRVRTLLAIIGGLGLLVLAGTLIVDGARAIARSSGLDEFVIGATVVAVGTSVPELATAVMARIRGHDEVGLGTILGSNLFNGLFIVGLAAVIHPIPVAPREVFVALAFGVAAMALVWPVGDGTIGRFRGVLLLALYLAYVLAVLA